MKEIKTPPASRQYRENYDKVFSNHFGKAAILSFESYSRSVRDFDKLYSPATIVIKTTEGDIRI